MTNNHANCGTAQILSADCNDDDKYTGMTIVEELTARDLSSNKPDNIYARVLKYIEKLENELESYYLLTWKRK